MLAVTFGPYHDLADASVHAPPASGVFQVKLARGLVDYPRGKSAMVHYAATDDLRAAIAAFADAHAGRPWRCRFVAAADAAALHDDLLARFTERFGRAPAPPTPEPR